MAQIFFHDGKWMDEQPRLTGPMDHAFWMASMVFDGARAYGGLAPDLKPHCERLIRSANALLLPPTKTAEEVEALCVEAIKKLPKDGEYYVRPMFFARDGFVSPDPDSIEFVLSVYDAPLPEPTGIKVGLSSFRRPARDMAPTDSKASCLYPNSQRALAEAASKGFDNALICDPSGNVAELATANVWMVKDGVAMTPVWNGTFLNGVTRQRVAALLADDGVEVLETTLTPDDFRNADEIFTTGNFAKVAPIIQFEDRELQPGPISSRARQLYFDWSEQSRIF